MDSEEISKIVTVLSSELESGRGGKFFTDTRGGFANTISWAENAVQLQEPDQSTIKVAEQYIEKCRSILSCVQSSGWDVVTKRVVIEYAAKMANHKW